jgi:hypothetical protein
MESLKRKRVHDSRGKEGSHYVEIENGEALVFIDWDDGTEEVYTLDEFVNLLVMGPFYYPPSD